MPRDSRVYLEDILEATRKITTYTVGLSKAAFLEDEKTLDAVIRNLEVIGEAVKKLPAELRAKHPVPDWKKIAGLRDILIHEYFGLDAEIVGISCRPKYLHSIKKFERCWANRGVLLSSEEDIQRPS